MSKISELSDGGSLVSSDYLIAVRSGGNVKVRMDQINVDQVDLGDNEFIRLGNSQDLTMVHNATNSIINQAGIGNLLIQKAGSTKLTINASGIDVTGSVTADGLTVDGNPVINGTSPQLFLQTGASNTNWQIAAQENVSNAFEISSGAADASAPDDTYTPRLVILNTGSVGIGTSVINSTLSVGSTDSGATITSGGTNTHLQLKAMGSGGVLIFGAGGVANGTAGVERLRIDALGNLLVGKTSTGINTAGHELFASGEVFHSVAGTPLYVNRIGSDGPIQNFYKDGAPVGSIGVSGGNNLYISGLAVDHSGLTFATNQILPSAVGAITDGAESLGSTSNRFKDLYLSGTAKLNFINHSETIYPTTDAAVDIGTSSERYRNLHLSGTAYAGSLLVGTTSIADTEAGAKIFSDGRMVQGLSGTGLADMHDFYRGTAGSLTRVGNIRTDGSSTTYNTSSDRRLKENIADADDAGSKIDAIQVRKFDWKADGSHQDYGMVAQELLEVAPEAVSASEDPEEMMGVDYSKLVPMMLKEIQSLRARVAQLEGAK